MLLQLHRLKVRSRCKLSLEINIITLKILSNTTYNHSERVTYDWVVWTREFEVQLHTLRGQCLCCFWTSIHYRQCTSNKKIFGFLKGTVLGGRGISPDREKAPWRHPWYVMNTVLRVFLLISVESPSRSTCVKGQILKEMNVGLIDNAARNVMLLSIT